MVLRWSLGIAVFLVTVVLGSLRDLPSWIVFDGVVALFVFIGATAYSIRQFRMSKNPYLLIRSRGFSISTKEMTGSFKIKNVGNSPAHDIQVLIYMRRMGHGRKGENIVLEEIAVHVFLEDDRGRADPRVHTVLGNLELTDLEVNKKYNFLDKNNKIVIMDSSGKLERFFAQSGSGIVLPVFVVKYRNFANQYLKQSMVFIEGGTEESFVPISSERAVLDTERKWKTTYEVWLQNYRLFVGKAKRKTCASLAQVKKWSQKILPISDENHEEPDDY